MKFVKDAIESLVDQIYRNRWDTEFQILNRQLKETMHDFNRRGILRSGAFYSTVGRLHGEFLLRVVNQTLEQLELTFKQAGRNDGNLFWDTVNVKLQTLVEPNLTSLNNASVDFAAQHGGKDVMASSAASSGFRRIGDQLHHFLVNWTRELRLRTQVIKLKSPEDRKANGIPDVAVMMWFPSEDNGGVEAVTRANEKYAAIEEAVRTASNGLATVNKIDDPNLVHKDRISPSVETWLAKSVLVICDLEGNRPNVFYEFGFTRAAGTDVIAIRPKGTDTHFHLAQWTIDEYSGWEDLKAKITPRIKTVLANYDLSGTT